MPAPVTIIGGFLGAGKTTLLNRILCDPRGVRYGVLVNDFAALNIDAELVRDTAPNRIALTNGCVCCTISDDMLASAFQLLRSPERPEHLLIECSGVSDPGAVARALTSELAGGALEIQALVCLVDAANVLALDFDETERIIDQAASSDLVLINKCDVAANADVESIEQILRDAQPMMRIVRTDQTKLPLELITGDFFPLSGAADRHAVAVPAAPSIAAHRDQYVSQVWSSSPPLSLEAFKQVVKSIPASVYRAKGIIRFVEHPGQRAVFQLVGSRSEISFEACEETDGGSMLVAIGRAATFDATAFDPLFGRGSDDPPVGR